MARYIDADKLVEMYERSANDDRNKRTSPSSWAEAFECAIADIDEQPTADVAPKSEVAREIFEEIEKMLKNQEVVAKNPREKELGDWILHNYIPKKIAELKKEIRGG